MKKKFKVGIDIRFALNSPRGIGKYVENLINILNYTNSDYEYYYFGNKPKLSKNLSLVVKKNYIYINNFGGYLLWEQVYLPYYAKKHKIDILHSTGNTFPLLLNKNIKLVVTLHDIFFLYPRSFLNISTFYQFFGIIYRSFNLMLGYNRINKIITVSDFAKKEISKKKYLSKFNINVIYNLVSDEYLRFKPKLLSDRKNQIIIITGKSKQKNNKWLIKKLKLFFLKSKINWKVLIIGAEQSHLKEKYDKQFKYIDYVDNKKLRFYYDQSKILIFASKFESFGIPIIEGLSRGLYVLANKSGASSEIGSKFISYFEIKKNNFDDNLKILMHKNKINQIGINHIKRLVKINLKKFKNIYD